MFPIAALLSGIPVFSIIIRYNLINEGVPKLWANLFAVLFPWAVSLFFYAGEEEGGGIVGCVPSVVWSPRDLLAR